ncbi:DUF4255 domain-containing protein [Halogeometricum borinquense]|uniref:DUF4255 domain-containing protein n=1 Tax=Halogeometricum borinquense TaxID=60847 RepID=A0A6C0UNG2_9EURY|nr:DUF4255 domain-containing protein [Halogeometricum borinquense]QIB76123.1 DUF4255 domain-containing protein [Halogeometricum borinquense]
MTYEAIRYVSEALVDLLKETADYPELPVEPDEIELISPADIGPNSTVRIGFYPYRVRKDGSVGSMNTTPVGESAKRDPPLPITIDYLVTAYPRDDEDNVTGTIGQQQALGLVLQTLNDVGILEPEETEGIEQDTRIGLTITNAPLDEVFSLWARFDATYQPSVTVEVSPVMIQSINEAEFSRIAERDVGVERKPDSE